MVIFIILSASVLLLGHRFKSTIWSTIFVMEFHRLRIGTDWRLSLLHPLHICTALYRCKVAHKAVAGFSAIRSSLSSDTLDHSVKELREAAISLAERAQAFVQRSAALQSSDMHNQEDLNGQKPTD